MLPTLPPDTAPRVMQSTGRVTQKSLDALHHLIVVMPEKAPASAWQRVPGGRQFAPLARRAGKDGVLRGRLANPAGTGISVVRIPRDASPFRLLARAGAAAKDALADNPSSVGIMAADLPGDDEPALRTTLTALLAHAQRAPKQAKENKPPAGLRSIRLLGLERRLELDACIAEDNATRLCRWLTALPPNVLDAGAYREAIRTLAKKHGWSFRFLDTKALKKLGAGAFLAVSQGNAADDAGIVHLKYRPGRASRPALALVGKGIVFDTGGNNLKPFRSMLDMHQDMAGSATALGILQALTETGYPHPVDCWLAITENRISAKAYKSRDVVTAVNGVHIETIHTDAEGRMVLADTLALAGREKPGLVLDYATLTGACVGALTERYSGVFTNRPALNDTLVTAGVDSGERVWPFPMDDDYDEDIASKAADVLQCSVAGSGDHILAARFLKRFVPEDAAWVHMDLSSASRDAGLAHMPGGATGFGIRYTLTLLRRHGAALAEHAGLPAPDAA